MEDNVKSAFRAAETLEWDIKYRLTLYVKKLTDDGHPDRADVVKKCIDLVGDASIAYQGNLIEQTQPRTPTVAVDPDSSGI